MFDGVEIRALCTPVKFFLLINLALRTGAFPVETGNGQTQTVDTKVEERYASVAKLTPARLKIKYVLFVIRLKETLN